MSDEALFMSGLKLNYNKSTYLKMYEKINEKVEKINSIVSNF